MSLADDLRQKSKDQNAAASDLSTSFSITEVQADGEVAEIGRMELRMLVASIVGHVKASMYSMQADILDYQRLYGNLETTQEQVNKNNVIRLAAAKGFQSGNWDEFNTLVDGGAGSPISEGTD